jgi:hypothetical protein
MKSQQGKKGVVEGGKHFFRKKRKKKTHNVKKNKHKKP